MSGYVMLSAGIILFSIVISFFLLRIFKTPIQALWSNIVIGLCNYMLLASIMLLLTHFNVFIFCLVVVIGMIIFTVLTARVTQTSNKTARNIVAIFILIDFIAFIMINKLF